MEKEGIKITPVRECFGEVVEFEGEIRVMLGDMVVKTNFKTEEEAIKWTKKHLQKDSVRVIGAIVESIMNYKKRKEGIENDERKCKGSDYMDCEANNGDS